MKKILLISDTHGFIDDKILSYCKSVDEVWHAGDIGSLKIIDQLKEFAPIKAVYGNIDGSEIRKEFEEVISFRCEDIKVMITHIGGYPGRYAKGIKEILKTKKTNLFISGHSHILKVMHDKTSEHSGSRSPERGAKHSHLPF